MTAPYPPFISQVLIIGYVWPETNASAAGIRDWALMEQFRQAGMRVTYASPAKPNAFSEKLEALGVPTFSCPANEPRFDAFIAELKPELVLFDRFITEEQFGWRVEEICPGALRVVDTQDLHFLRRAREAALKAGWPLDQIQEASEDMVEKFAQEDSLRELSSIYRSDLSLIISSFEINLLKTHYKVPENLLLLQRFSYAPPATPLPFSERNHFVTIGNFRHPPNMDALRWFAQDIWPLIRKRLPHVEAHIYGAYPSREAMEMSDPKLGFFVKGPAEDQYKTLSQYRVLLAPLRYGAGIKGKIADAWSTGTAVVTTPIGAEGMTDSSNDWPGEIGWDAQSLADRACELYGSEKLWLKHQDAGFAALSRHYSPTSNSRALLTRIAEINANLAEHRRNNRTGAMLRHNLHKSTKYFSKWIEQKQLNKN